MFVYLYVAGRGENRLTFTAFNNLTMLTTADLASFEIPAKESTFNICVHISNTSSSEEATYQKFKQSCTLVLLQLCAELTKLPMLQNLSNTL